MTACGLTCGLKLLLTHLGTPAVLPGLFTYLVICLMFSVCTRENLDNLMSGGTNKFNMQHFLTLLLSSFISDC